MIKDLYNYDTQLLLQSFKSKIMKMNKSFIKSLHIVKLLKNIIVLEKIHF